MPLPDYQPIYQLSRGESVESIHYGAVAVVDIHGELIAWYGDPYAVTFLRSSAKPFQVLPFLEAGGQQAFDLTPAEIAVICASHTGTDEHIAVVQGIQSRVGCGESDLLCGVHPPFDQETARELLTRGAEPTPNHHNCSGKHTGMLAYARLKGWSTTDYIAPDHPVQVEILKTFAETCSLMPEQVSVGTDGCSAPNFAVPLYNAALAYARLSDPAAGPSGITAGRAAACCVVIDAMRSHPRLVGGPGNFDTSLMEVAAGRIVAKGGAEGYQGVGVLPGALSPGSPALGIAVKISDGDLKGRARPGVVLEILRQLGALSPTDLESLSSFGPASPVHNWRKRVVGRASPTLTLSR